MSTAPGPESTPPNEEGVSLEELSRAYAEAIGQSPNTYSGLDGARPEDASTVPGDEAREAADDSGGVPEDRLPDPGEEAPEQSPCEISPTSILEAMLFVGNRACEPLSCARAAELMRGVEPGEIPDLVEQLNRRYASNGCPYHIVSEGAGYRLALCEEFSGVRNKFYGRLREARLSQAAIDVLAIVAYQQPITAEEVTSLRGTPSGPLLAQLVGRRLLAIERPSEKPRSARYRTSSRFLELFGLERLEDLPQSDELELR